MARVSGGARGGEDGPWGGEAVGSTRKERAEFVPVMPETANNLSHTLSRPVIN